MFGQNKNTASYTDLFLLEMAKKMIHNGWDINIKFLLQAKWMYRKPFDPLKNRTSWSWVIAENTFITEVREVVLTGIYARESGEAYGFKVEFTLVRERVEARWSIIRAFIWVDDGEVRRADFHFTRSGNALGEIDELQKLLLKARTN